MESFEQRKRDPFINEELYAYEILCEGLRGDRDKQQAAMSVYLKR